MYHTSERHDKGEKPLIVRKCSLTGVAVPEGWHGESDNYHEYSTLASDTFPQNISKHCTYVVGPKTAGPGFQALDEGNIPYHIRAVDSFKNLQVWVMV